jgi:hypothetical protein
LEKLRDTSWHRHEVFWGGPCPSDEDEDYQPAFMLRCHGANTSALKEEELASLDRGHKDCGERAVLPGAIYISSLWYGDNAASRDIAVKSLAPTHTRILTGYTGWGPQQLEDEINRDHWIVVQCSMSLMLSCDFSLAKNMCKWCNDVMKHDSSAKENCVGVPSASDSSDSSDSG